jgi:uncharacterized protein YjiS (DUF1127 family)
LASGRAGALEVVSTAASRLFDLLLAWQTRTNDRRQLADMDSRLLADIGLSRADALKEASKPFWRG